MTLTCTNVTLRQKTLRNDHISLYLDYYPAIRNPYTMKMYNPQIEMFARFKTKSSFHKTKRII